MAVEGAEGVVGISVSLVSSETVHLNKFFSSVDAHLLGRRPILSLKGPISTFHWSIAKSLKETYPFSTFLLIRVTTVERRT